MIRTGIARRGVTLVEYGLLVMLVAIVAIGTVTALGGSVTDMFGGLTSSMGGSSGSGGGSGPGFSDPDACAGGFEPGSLVSVSYGPVNGNPALPTGTLPTVTADSNGEITDCGPLVIPIEVPPDSYHREFIGIAPGGAPLTTTAPVVISSPDVDIEPTAPPAPIEPTAGMMTMTVRVRDCSAVYLREEATMNSPSTLHYPGTTWEVYATQGWWTATDNPAIHASLAPAIVGGGWPEYTCDGGASNTWFELTDGTGYVFTGGVDIIGGPYAGWPRHIDPDTSVPFVITTACEDAVFTFDGVAGERYAWQYTGQTFTGDETVKRPNGTNLVGGHTAASGSSHYHDTITLDATGVHTITNGPRSCATGSGTLNIWNVPADEVEPITIDGAPATMNMSVVGQNGYFQMSGTAGQVIAMNRSGNLTSNADFWIQRPSGSNLIGGETFAAGFRDRITLNETGTYRLWVSPGGMNTGSATVEVWSIPNDPSTALTINGGAGSITTTLPGQYGEFTFTATAGQTISWQATGSPLNRFHASLIAPDGSSSSRGRMSDNGGAEGPISLTQTGTYTIRADAESSYTGTVTLSITGP